MKPALNGNQCGFLGAGFFFVVEDEWDGKSEACVKRYDLWNVADGNPTSPNIHDFQSQDKNSEIGDRDQWKTGRKKEITEQ